MRDTRAQRGSSIVEFALVGSVAILLLLAIIDFGFALYSLHLASDVARMGSRWAMVRGSTCTYPECPATAAATGAGSVQGYVRSVSPGVDVSKLTVTTTWPQAGTPLCPNGNEPGCVVSVKVQYPYSFLGFELPNTTLQISTTAQNVIAR